MGLKYEKLEEKTSSREFQALPQGTQDEVLRRMKLLKIFKCNCSTKGIKEFALENNVGVATLHGWRKSYERSGWIGLIPKHGKKGRKKGLRPELEELIQKVIGERYLRSFKIPIKQCYEFLVIECIKRDIDPPSLTTFYHRVREASQARKILRRRVSS